MLALIDDMTFRKNPLDKRSKTILKKKWKIPITIEIMEGPKRMATNVPLPSKHYVSSL